MDTKLRINLPIILFITFLDYLSISVFYGTVIPLSLAKHSVFSVLSASYDKSIIFGFILLIMPLSQFLIAPWWGQVSDEFGRKSVLLVTLIGSAVGYMFMGMGITGHIFWLFVLGRAFTAVMAVNTAIGYASVADVTGQKKRAGRFNLQFIAISLGFIAGPYLISFTTKSIHYQSVYWVIATAYVVAFILVVLRFQESLVNRPAQATIKWFINFQLVFGIFKEKRLKQLFVVWIVFQLGWSLFFQFSGEFLYQYRHVSNDHINHIFSWLGLGALISQVFLVRPLAKRVAPQKIVPWAILLIGASLVVMGFVPVNISFYIVLGLYCLGISFFLTNMNAYVSNVAKPEEQGRTMAMMSSSQALMDIVVTLIGSFIVAKYLPTPYVVGGGILLLSWLCWLPFVKQRV